MSSIFHTSGKLVSNKVYFCILFTEIDFLITQQNCLLFESSAATVWKQELNFAGYFKMICNESCGSLRNANIIAILLHAIALDSMYNWYGFYKRINAWLKYFFSDEIGFVQ